MRPNITTSLGARTAITTSLSSRTDGNFLMTQALDFLMTEDENYIVLQNSYSAFASLTRRTPITTNLA